MSLSHYFNRNKVLGIVSISLLFPVLYFSMGILPANRAKVYLKATGYSLLYTTCLWMGSDLLMYVLDKKVPWQNGVIKRIIIQSLLLVVLVFVVATPIILLLENRNVHKNLMQGYLEAGAITFFMNASHIGRYFYYQWKNELLQKETLLKEQSEFRLHNLRAQIDPHFLFNSLNTLNQLIDENKEIAQQYVAQLSNVYRNLLQTHSEPTTLLQDELELAKAYLFLHQMRFNQGLQVNWTNCQPYANNKIISTATQTLLENAIKHNTISANKPLTITIECLPMGLAISNNVQAKSNSQGTGIGLSNLQAQYQLIANKNIEINKNDQTFSVFLPWI